MRPLRLACIALLLGCSNGEEASPPTPSTKDASGETVSDLGIDATDDAFDASMGDTAPPADTADVATDTLSDTKADADAGACNAIVLVDPAVPDERSSAAHPTYVGGTLEDGRYVMTKHIRYGVADAGSSGTTSQAELVVAGGVIQFAADFGGSGVVTNRSTSTYSASGNAIIFSLTCPKVATEGFLYTATSTVFEYCECSLTGISGEALTFIKK